MKKSVFVVGVISTVLIIGCGTLMLGTTMNYTFLDDAIPVENHCRLYVHHELNVMGFDENKRSVVTPLMFDSGNQQAMVSVIPSGRHSFLVDYVSDERGGYYSKASGLTLTYDFLPDRFYYMFPLTEGRTVSLRVIDATDISAEDSFIFESYYYISELHGMREEIVKARTQSEEKLRNRR